MKKFQAFPHNEDTCVIDLSGLLGQPTGTSVMPLLERDKDELRPLKSLPKIKDLPIELQIYSALQRCEGDASLLVEEGYDPTLVQQVQNMKLSELVDLVQASVLPDSSVDDLHKDAPKGFFDDYRDGVAKIAESSWYQTVARLNVFAMPVATAVYWASPSSTLAKTAFGIVAGVSTGNALLSGLYYYNKAQEAYKAGNNELGNKLVIASVKNLLTVASSFAQGADSVMSGFNLVSSENLELFRKIAQPMCDFSAISNIFTLVDSFVRGSTTAVTSSASFVVAALLMTVNHALNLIPAAPDESLTEGSYRGRREVSDHPTSQEVFDRGTSDMQSAYGPLNTAEGDLRTQFSSFQGDFANANLSAYSHLRTGLTQYQVPAGRFNVSVGTNFSAVLRDIIGSFSLQGGSPPSGPLDAVSNLDDLQRFLQEQRGNITGIINDGCDDVVAVLTQARTQAQGLGFPTSFTDRIQTATTEFNTGTRDPLLSRAGVVVDTVTNLVQTEGTRLSTTITTEQNTLVTPGTDTTSLITAVQTNLNGLIAQTGVVIQEGSAVQNLLTQFNTTLTGSYADIDEFQSAVTDSLQSAKDQYQSLLSDLQTAQDLKTTRTADQDSTRAKAEHDEEIAGRFKNIAIAELVLGGFAFLLEVILLLRISFMKLPKVGTQGEKFGKSSEDGHGCLDFGKSAGSHILHALAKFFTCFIYEEGRGFANAREGRTRDGDCTPKSCLTGCFVGIGRFLSSQTQYEAVRTEVLEERQRAADKGAELLKDFATGTTK